MADETQLANSLTGFDAGSPVESLRALDWLNFFLAALLTGFGPYVAVHLAESGWTPASIGSVLTISGLVGLLTQVPAGELIDVVKSKRELLGAATVAAALALAILGVRSDFLSIAGAAVIQGGVGSVLGPSVAAISLGLVGHHALAERLGGISVLRPSEVFAQLRSWAPWGICCPREIFFCSPPHWQSRCYGHSCRYAEPTFTSAGPVAHPIIT